MNTAFLLMAQFEKTIIPARDVAKIFDVSEVTLLRKIGKGEIALPLIRLENSREGAKGVHISDLAAYIDAKRAAAQKEAKAMQA